MNAESRTDAEFVAYCDAYNARSDAYNTFVRAARAARAAGDDDAYSAARDAATAAGIIVRELVAFERWGDRGWRWEERWTGVDQDQVRIYRTNSDGEGLFFCRENGSYQLAGTSQYRLPAQRGPAVSALLRQGEGLVNRLPIARSRTAR